MNPSLVVVNDSQKGSAESFPFKVILGDRINMHTLEIEDHFVYSFPVSHCHAWKVMFLSTFCSKPWEDDLSDPEQVGWLT